MEETFNDDVMGIVDPFAGQDDQLAAGNEFDFSDLDEVYDAAEVHEQKEVPVGKYQCFIYSNKIGAYSDKTPFLNLCFKVISGTTSGDTYRGQTIPKNYTMTSKFIEYLKGDLHRLGKGDIKPSMITSRRNELLDIPVEIAIVENKKNPQYNNVYIQRVINIAIPDDLKPNDSVLDGTDCDDSI